MLVPRRIEFKNLVLYQSNISMASYLYLWYLEGCPEIIEKQYKDAEQKLVRDGIIDDVIEFCNQNFFKYWKSSFWYRKRSISDYYYLFEGFFKYGHTATYVMKPFSDEQVMQAFTMVVNYMLKEMYINKSYLRTIRRNRDVVIVRD